MKIIRRLLTGFATVTAIFFVIITVAFLLNRKAAEQEWGRKFPSQPRTKAEVRGIIDNMFRYRTETIPSFVPQSGWDNELCAANIVEGVNFILGTKKLKVTKAWKFASVNASQIKLVYDRSKDFVIQNGQVKEIKDRGFYLSRLLQVSGEKEQLTSDRLYIIGYHYRFTQSDNHIIAAQADGGTLNSHLMLVLGRYDGTWWGYHMIHESHNAHSNPFKIDDVGEQMPRHFDLLYIWEVIGTELPLKGTGSNLLLSQNSPPLTHFSPWLGWLGRGRKGYIFDSAIMTFVGRGDNFPTTINLDQAVIDIPQSGGKWRGQIKGFYHGVPVRRQIGATVRGAYGLEFECVEFINRYFYQYLRHSNMAKSGNADSYFYGATAKKLEAFPNGSTEPPQPDDILVFDSDGAGGEFGHLAVVYQITAQEVCVVQQNKVDWRQCLPLIRKNSGYEVAPIEKPLPCVGWAKRRNP